MKEGFSVRGLTTAACFWVVAAIGMATGAAQYTLAVSVCFISLVSLSLLHRIDKLYKRYSYRSLTINTGLDVEIKAVIDTIKHRCVTILFVDSDRDYEKKTISITFALRIFHKGTTDKISHEIIASLETADIPLKNVSWHHGKM